MPILNGELCFFRNGGVVIIKISFTSMAGFHGSITRLFCIFFIIIGSLFTKQGITQDALERIEDFPSKEIYDLHVDQKGYLWIAHGLGISRYDGLNFIHFRHPQATALQMTEIAEDKYGKIWCHTIAGQVFYVENGKLNVLGAYHFKAENQTPHMVLCEDELIITSRAGLFICSVKTLQSKYLVIDNKSAGQSSLSLIKNKVVLLRKGEWYIYQKHFGVQKLLPDSTIEIKNDNLVTLQPAAFKDTIFLVTNPAGTLQKLLLEKKHIRLAAKEEYHDYINSVVVDEKSWVNSRNTSQTSDLAVVRKGYNLSDAVTGKEGNIWFSSLNQGLMVNFQPTKWKKIKFPIANDDFVRCLNVEDGYVFAGTQKGYLLMMWAENAEPVWKYNLFNGYGSVEFIRFLGNHRFIVGTSTHTYIVKPAQKQIEATLPMQAVLDVDFDHQNLYIATANGFYTQAYQPEFLQQYKPVGLNLKEISADFFLKQPRLLSPQRSQAVRYYPNHKSVFFSTKNGLQQLDTNGIQRYTIEGKEVFASSLWYKHPRLYIATINNGLWIKDQSVIKHLTAENNLFSNTILALKVTGDHLWLLEDNGIQVFDLKTDQVLNFFLPRITGSDVFDVAEKNGFVYLTTAKGLYKIFLKPITHKAPIAYLDYVVVNNNDTLLNNGVQLKYDKNDLQFFFSSPSYYNPEAVSFKYRLIGDDNHWQAIRSRERMLRFSSLPPGSYTFEVVAVNKNGWQQVKPVSFQFLILKPWWRTWWFIGLVNILIVLVVVSIMRSRINHRLKVELIRRGIAGDLHDDIGATLSSVNIYAEMAQEEMGPNEYLDRVKTTVQDTMSRLDDLVWSINPKNDSMPQLMHRMQVTSAQLLEAKGVHCRFLYDDAVTALKLSLAEKRNLYLLFKEMLNNVVKHARCRNCFIEFNYVKGRLMLSVRDDGIGFDPGKMDTGRNGIESMKYRAKQLNGSIRISSLPDKGSSLVVELKA